MRLRRPTVVLSLVLLLAVAGGVAWLRRHDRVVEPDVAAASPATTDTSPAAVAPGDDAIPVVARPTAPTPPSEPLPPLDAPLDGFAEALAARADAGDSAAACRLGLELMRCRSLRPMNTDMAALWQEQALQIERGEDQSDALPARRAAEAERLLTLADRYRPVAEACGRVPETLHARGEELLRRAALAGEPEALLMYASGDNAYAYGLHGQTGWLRSPTFDRWRHEAPRMLQRALATGRPEVVLLYADGTAGGEGAVQGLLPDDPQQAAAWRALARRLFGRETDRLLQTLVPLPGDVDVDAAEAQAAAWHARHFDGATFREQDLLARTLLDQSATPAATRAFGSGCGGMP